MYKLVSEEINKIVEEYKKLPNEQKKKDVRYFIKDIVQENYNTIWNKNEEDLFMLIPKVGRFGRIIFSLKTGSVVCGDIPCVTEGAWDELAHVFDDSKKYALHAGVYIRIYFYNNKMKISLERHFSVDNVKYQNTISGTNLTNFYNEINNIVFNKIDKSKLDKGTTYIFALYSPNMISELYYGDYEIVELVAEINNSTGECDMKRISLYEGTDDVIIRGNKIFYSPRFKKSAAFLENCKDLTTILLKNRNNFSDFYFYFPIEKWAFLHKKLLNTISKTANYISRNIGDYLLINAELEYKKLKNTPENVEKIFEDMPYYLLYEYLS